MIIGGEIIMKDCNYLASELCKLGLKKKEANAYLVLLELGYCSVQKIAQKLKLSRPTVYRILKILENKELISIIQKGKRNYFIAGSPDTLLNMLRIKKRKAEEQEREFLRIINTLQDQYSFSSDENTIETYSNEKRQLANEKLTSTQHTKIKIISTEENSQIEEILGKIKARLGSSLKIKRLYFDRASTIKKSFIENKLIKGKPIFSKRNIIIADRIFIFKNNKISIVKRGCIIESFELLFDIIWKIS